MGWHVHQPFTTLTPHAWDPERAPTAVHDLGSQPPAPGTPDVPGSLLPEGCWLALLCACMSLCSLPGASQGTAAWALGAPGPRGFSSGDPVLLSWEPYNKRSKNRTEIVSESGGGMSETSASKIWFPPGTSQHLVICCNRGGSLACRRVTRSLLHVHGILPACVSVSVAAPPLCTMT